jgi:hypothetical protein
MARNSEPDYLAIAKRKAGRPKTHAAKQRKFLVYGRNKKGKTWFGASAGTEQTLILDPERGTDTMVSKNPYVWPITRWEDLQEAWGALRTGELSPKTLGLGKSDVPFTYLVVDGMTRMNNMALKFVMAQEEQKNLDRKPGMVDRRDYGKSGQLLHTLITNIHTLPMGVIYTAQERMITGDAGDDDSDDESVYFVADLPNAPRAVLYSIVDVIGRLYVVRVPKKGEVGEYIAQRRLQIGIHEKYDTGFRSDFKLPDVIKNPTVPKLEQLMLEGE